MADKLDQSALASVVVGKFRAVSIRSMFPNIINEPRIGVAEPVNGLFRVTNPATARREASQSAEDSELQRVCVLKLINQNKIEIFSQTSGEAFVLKKFE